MFLTATLARNPRLVEAAAGLHRTGRIPPDTYLIDLDAVAANAAALAAVAAAHDVRLWPVFKQVGRNPHVIRTVAEHLPLAAAIDLRGAGRSRTPGRGSATSATSSSFRSAPCGTCWPGAPRTSPSSEPTRPARCPPPRSTSGSRSRCWPGWSPPPTGSTRGRRAACPWRMWRSSPPR
ncbi:hypothetical protein LUX33_47580 [Actinomadura madurae]|nr:hypothetical protein [Actinomadura madurae]MCP9955272.1 hypothetical protein [Actinomadura madurae]